MKAKLLEILKEGTERVREIPLTGEDFLIGRGSDCELRLHHNEISRHHCLIQMRHREVTISDLGSSNGTFVNGQRVVSQLRLKTGDQILLGPCQFSIDLGDQQGWRPFSDVDSLAKTIQTIPDEMKRRLREEQEKMPEASGG